MAVMERDKERKIGSREGTAVTAGRCDFTFMGRWVAEDLFFSSLFPL